MLFLLTHFDYIFFDSHRYYPRRQDDEYDEGRFQPTTRRTMRLTTRSTTTTIRTTATPTAKPTESSREV